MKKKIILVVIVVFAVAVSGAFVLTKCLKTNSNHEQVNVVEDKDHRKTYVTVNKDGYVINQKCIRVADEKLLFELTFDMFIEK